MKYGGFDSFDGKIIEVPSTPWKFPTLKQSKPSQSGCSNFPLPSKPEGNPSVSSPIRGITHEMTKWGCLLCVFVVNHAVNPIMNLNWGMIYRWVYLKNKSWKGCLWVISDPILVIFFCNWAKHIKCILFNSRMYPIVAWRGCISLMILAGFKQCSLSVSTEDDSSSNYHIPVVLNYPLVI